MDSYGVEIIHPIREGKNKQSQRVSNKGKSNRKWIVGRKINLAINSNLEVINFQDETDNVSDNTFNPEYEDINGIMLTDKGYRKDLKKGETPKNFKICEAGKMYRCG